MNNSSDLVRRQGFEPRTRWLSAGGFDCFPLCPVVCPIPLGGNDSPTSSIHVRAGRFRTTACHLRCITVTWPYS
jgi:hypothetical protein